MRNLRACAGALAVLVSLGALPGCRTVTSVETGMTRPTFEIEGSGVKFDGAFIMPEEAPKILKKHQIPVDRVIYVRVAAFDEFAGPEHPEGFQEGKVAVNESQRLREARAFMAVLWRGGYHKSVLVTDEKADSWTTPAHTKKGDA